MPSAQQLHVRQCARHMVTYPAKAASFACLPYCVSMMPPLHSSIVLPTILLLPHDPTWTPVKPTSGCCAARQAPPRPPTNPQRPADIPLILCHKPPSRHAHGHDAAYRTRASDVHPLEFRPVLARPCLLVSQRNTLGLELCALDVRCSRLAHVRLSAPDTNAHTRWIPVGSTRMQQPAARP
jgi:hypothetical protein